MPHFHIHKFEEVLILQEQPLGDIGVQCHGVIKAVGPFFEVDICNFTIVGLYKTDSLEKFNMRNCCTKSILLLGDSYNLTCGCLYHKCINKY